MNNLKLIEMSVMSGLGAGITVTGIIGFVILLLIVFIVIVFIKFKWDALKRRANEEK